VIDRGEDIKTFFVYSKLKIYGTHEKAPCIKSTLSDNGFKKNIGKGTLPKGKDFTFFSRSH